MVKSLVDLAASFLLRRKLRGGGFIVRTFAKGRRIEAKSKHGLRWRLDPDEYVDRFVLTHGFYEEEVIEALVSRIRPGDCFWDVGANLGLHALTIKHLEPGTSVYAFEPNPALSRLLAEVALANDVEVTVSPVALDEKAGPAEFFIFKGNVGMSGLRNWQGDASAEVIEVEKDTGDALASSGRVRRPNVIKIDAEGSEHSILKGMTALLAGQDLHTLVIEDSPDGMTPLKTLLRRAGFTLDKLERKEPTHHNLENYLAAR